MMRLFLSDTDEQVIRKLDELPDEFGYLSFKALIRLGVPAHSVRRVVRKLARMGITRFASGLWTDDGEPAGSGYALTKFGRALASAIEARRAETRSGSVHESAGPQGDAHTPTPEQPQ